MFNSISNNFGAGTIQFKDVQESNYIVLNAKFTCDPQSAAYQAAETLEITVPTLSIDRSTVAGVVVRFQDRQVAYGRTYNYDGGTVAKSWVKDANTLCIEKLSCFDDQTELIIYIQALYCQLAQGGNATKGKSKSIKCISDGSFLSLDTSHTFCVVYDKWVFYHMMYSGCSYAMRSSDWEAFFENLPEDIVADVPVMASYNYEHSNLGGITECHIEDGYFTFLAEERPSSFDNTANYVFSFAFLVRDYVEEPVIAGRLKYASEQLQAGTNQYFKDVDMELEPQPAMVALSGSMGIYSAGPFTFQAPDFPDGIPEFDAFFLGAHQHSNGLTVQLLEMEVRRSGESATIKMTDCSGDNNMSFKLFDTSVVMRTTYSN